MGNVIIGTLDSGCFPFQLTLQHENPHLFLIIIIINKKSIAISNVRKDTIIPRKNILLNEECNI